MTVPPGTRAVLAVLAVFVLSCSPGGEGRPTDAPSSAAPGAQRGLLSDVLTYKGNSDRTGELPGPGPRGQPILRWEKTYNLAITAAPLVLDGKLVIVGHDGVVRSLDAMSGDELWNVALPAGVEQTPTIAGRTLYLIGMDGILRAVSLDSREQTWEAPDFLPRSLITVTDDLILAGAFGELVAVAAEDGEIAWRTSTGGSERASLGDGLVFAGGERSGVLTALSLEGEAQWQFPTDGAQVLTPAFLDEHAYIAARDIPGSGNVIFALDGEGSEAWRWEPLAQARIHGHAVTHEQVFVSTQRPASAVYALDRTTGERNWVQPFEAPLITIPIVADGIVYVASPDGAVALDGTTGGPRWQIDIGAPLEVTMTVTGGLLVITTTQQDGTSTVAAFADQPPPGAASAPPEATPGPRSPSPGALLTVISADPIEGESLLLATSVAPDGTMYVGDLVNSRIVIRHPDGSIESWGEHGSGPGQFNFSEVTQNDTSVGVSVSPDGALIVVGDGGNHRVQVFDADLNFLHSIGRLGRGDGQFVNPCCVTVDGAHRVWVVDTAREDVQVFDETGGFLSHFGRPGQGDGQLARPGAASVDQARNEVVIPDFGNRRLAVFDMDGIWLRNYVGRPAEGFVLGEVNYVVVDRFGRYWAVDTPANNLLVIDRDGSLIAAIPPEFPGAGRVEFASFALDDSGRLYFADILEGRLITAQLGAPLWPGGSGASPSPGP